MRILNSILDKQRPVRRRNAWMGANRARKADDLHEEQPVADHHEHWPSKITHKDMDDVVTPTRSQMNTIGHAGHGDVMNRPTDFGAGASVPLRFDLPDGAARIVATGCRP